MSKHVESSTRWLLPWNVSRPPAEPDWTSCVKTMLSLVQPVSPTTRTQLARLPGDTLLGGVGIVVAGEPVRAVGRHLRGALGENIVAIHADLDRNHVTPRRGDACSLQSAAR